jgi:hypothetical protein
MGSFTRANEGEDAVLGLARSAKPSWYEAMMRALVVLAAPCFAACSIFGDLEGDQCETADDCNAIGLTGYACSADHVCVSGADGQCVSNELCTQANQGIPHVCNRDTGRCARLKDDDTCQVLAGDGAWLAEDLFMMGIFLPLDGTNPGASTGVFPAQLAIEEINLEQGLPARGAAPQRKLLGIVCDQSDAAALPGVVDRLTNEVGVHAFVGELAAPELQSLMVNELQDEFVLATRANDQSLKGAAFNDKGHLWHAVGDVEDLAPVYPPLLADAEAQAVLDDMAPIRVMVILSTASAMTRLHAAVTPLLEFNDKDADANGADGNYIVRAVDGDDYGDVIEEAARDYHPHIVLGFADEAFADVVVPGIEQRWNETTFHPIYVATPGARYSQDLLGAATTFQFTERFIGVEFATDPAVYDDFAQALDVMYFAAPPPMGYNLLYDAIYQLAFAAYGAGGIPSIGADNLVEGIKRIDDAGGQVVYVGRGSGAGMNHFAEGIEFLTVSDGFQFHGTSGPLTWIEGDGSRDTAVGTYCLQLQPDDSVTYRFGAQRLMGSTLDGAGCSGI